MNQRVFVLVVLIFVYKNTICCDNICKKTTNNKQTLTEKYTVIIYLHYTTEFNLDSKLLYYVDKQVKTLS